MTEAFNRAALHLFSSLHRDGDLANAGTNGGKAIVAGRFAARFVLLNDAFATTRSTARAVA